MAEPTGDRGSGAWGRDSAISRDLALSLAFLTRLPARWLAISPDHLPDFRFAARAFPIAGAAVGVAGGLVLLAAHGLDLPPLVAGLLAVAATVVLTGALHEDGLADTADGFGGGRNRAAKLEILRDSRIGTYGALALIFSVGLRVALLASFLPRWPIGGALALVAAEAVGRAAIAHIWAMLPAAREDGLSASIGRPADEAAYAAALIAVAIGLVAGTIAASLIAAIVALAAAALATLAFEALAREQIGGQTGDTLGACEQIAALAFLTTLVAFA